MNDVYYLIDKDTEMIILRVTPKEGTLPYVEGYHYGMNQFVPSPASQGEVINPDYRKIKEEEVSRYIEKARKRI